MTFSCDNNDKPYAVKYNNITYYYVLNQQGDVIQIVDENGTTKAEYTYDAWENVIASTGTDSGIGAVNPLLWAKSSKLSAKAKSKDAPSWLFGKPPKKG